MRVITNLPRLDPRGEGTIFRSSRFFEWQLAFLRLPLIRGVRWADCVRFYLRAKLAKHSPSPRGRGLG
jgi:hypothetical protein